MRTDCGTSTSAIKGGLSAEARQGGRCRKKRMLLDAAALAYYPPVDPLRVVCTPTTRGLEADQGDMY